MIHIDRFFLDCTSFDDFHQRLKDQSNEIKGDAFERFAQVYLETAPEYQSRLEKIWLLDKVPAEVRAEINLPLNGDKGIDLIAKAKDGTYWAIQAKYRKDDDESLGWGNLATFFSLASAPRRNISYRVVFRTTTRAISNRALAGNKLIEIDFARLQETDWQLIRETIRENAPVRPAPRKPRPYQGAVIAKAVEHFKTNSRGRLLMPCGTGKTLLAFWITEALKAKTTIIAVPSLSLLTQSVGDWTREFAAHNQTPDYRCVASDKTVGNLNDDEFQDESYDSGLPTTTDVNEIADYFRKPAARKIVFTTYQSSKAVADAAQLAGIKADLIIFDEAHRTVGDRDREFATMLHDDNIQARFRLFTTATERKFKNGDVENALSMDEHTEDYGGCFYRMSFKQAIDLKIICDYDIWILQVTEPQVKKLITQDQLLNMGGGFELVGAQDMAAAIAVKRAMEERGVTHSLVFNRSVPTAKKFCGWEDELNERGFGPVASNFHINCEIPAGERKATIAQFAAAPRAVLTNKRCLTEGVDVPGIDCVVFAAPKQSLVDIVQATGRAVRNAQGKTKGVIVIPILVPEGMQFEELQKTTAFIKMMKIISALALEDTRLAEEIEALRAGPDAMSRLAREPRIQIGGTLPVGFRMSFPEYADAVHLLMYKRTVKFLPFEEVCTIVRAENFKDQIAFKAWEGRPPNIPSHPDMVYDEWKGWGNFLGNGNYRGFDGWPPYEETRAIVRPKHFRSQTAFKTWWRKTKPHGIPGAPQKVYAPPPAGLGGWEGWPGFLGNGYEVREFLPFKQARAIVHSQGFSSRLKFIGWKHRPRKSPAIPSAFIKARDGWAGPTGLAIRMDA